MIIPPGDFSFCALERQIRRWKREYVLAKETDQADLQSNAAARLAAARARLADFLQQTGRQKQQLRETVPGFGRSEASSAVWAVRMQARLDAANAELNQLREDGIIHSKGVLVLPPEAPACLIFEREHVFQRMLERELTFTDADRMISNARFALRQQGGAIHAYYTDQGFVAVHKSETIYTIAPLDEGGKKILEVAKRHGF